MNKLNPIRFATALTITAAIAYTICSFAFLAAPDLTYGFFSSFAHGMGLTASGVFGSFGMSFESYLLGLVCISLGAFALGGLFALTFNRTTIAVPRSERTDFSTIRPSEA